MFSTKLIHNTPRRNLQISSIAAAALVLLFVYTSVSKLLDFETFRAQMYNQNLPRELSTALIWSLPAAEIIVSFLLSLKKTRLAGLCSSLVLMVAFTGYVGLVLANYFDRIPCSCGGVISALGWRGHLFLNLFFLLLSALGIYQLNGERRRIGKKF